MSDKSTVTVTEVPYFELEPGRNTTLSKEEADAVNKRIEVMKKILKAPGTIARYRIEIQFHKKRSTWKPTPGMMSFWESGGKLHGGGATKLYICRSRGEDDQGCRAFLNDLSNTGMSLVCSNCGRVWAPGAVTGELFFNNTMQAWAEHIYHYYRMLGHNCDICLKHSPDDIRVVAGREQERQRGGELLNKMRDTRAPYVYPLANIIKDVAAGADIVTRFKAFLTA